MIDDIFTLIKKSAGLDGIHEESLRKALRKSPKCTEGYFSQNRRLSFAGFNAYQALWSCDWDNDLPVSPLESRIAYSCDFSSFWSLCFDGGAVAGPNNPSVIAVYARPMVADGFLGEKLPFVTLCSDQMGFPIVFQEELVNLGMVADKLTIVQSDGRARYLKAPNISESGISSADDLYCRCPGSVDKCDMIESETTEFGETADHIRLGMFTPYGPLEVLYAGSDVGEVYSAIRSSDDC